MVPIICVLAILSLELDGVWCPNQEGLQEDLIAKMEQAGTGSSRRGNQAGSAAAAAEKLVEQVQADVSHCHLDLN